MKYLLLSHDDERAWEVAGEDALAAARQEAVRLTHELDAKGQYITAAPLRASRSAVCVRVRNGEASVTDGPYAEAREVVGGFYLIDVPSREDAIRIAQRHPGARRGTVEVREIIELEGLPKSRL